MSDVDLLEGLYRATRIDGANSSDFDLNPDVVLSADRSLRNAAVLIAVSTHNRLAEVILTKRASSLKHHPGQIAFPGGKQDKEDTNLAQTALREAWEEIGLPPEKVTIIGDLPQHETVTGFNVTPVLGLIETKFDMIPEIGEVDEVFSVPLKHVVDPNNYQIQYRYWRGVKRKYYAVPFGPYYIWGATARILRGLADKVNQ